MGDEQNCLAVALPQVRKHLLHDLARLRIQCAEGLIHQQNLRVIREGARDRGPLLHSTGKRLGVGFGETIQFHRMDQLARTQLALCSGRPLELQSELNVAPHRQPGIQGIRLEHHAPVGARLGGRLPIDQHFAFGGLRETCRHH